MPEIDEAMLSCTSIAELKECIGHSPLRIVVLLDELKAKRPVGADKAYKGHLWKLTHHGRVLPPVLFSHCVDSDGLILHNVSTFGFIHS